MTTHEVLDFGAAIQQAGTADKALLVGNGFSMQYFGKGFGYGNLLELSDLPMPANPQSKIPRWLRRLGDKYLATDTRVGELFQELKTVDFEEVIRHLDGAEVVTRTYWGSSRSKILQADAERVRQALVDAIRRAHPERPDDKSLKFRATRHFLDQFDNVFCLNYDLLLNWIAVLSGWKNDGFADLSISSDGTARGPYLENPGKKEIHFLHGCLNLYTDRESGEVFKVLNYDRSVVGTVSKEVTSGKLIPLYVAEGTSQNKLKKIRRNDYLRDCHNSLLHLEGTLFVFGHHPGENDAHIYEAIFNSHVDRVFFGVRNPTKSRVAEYSEELSKYLVKASSRTPFEFYDSATAGI